jgi:hypothetical protein
MHIISFPYLGEEFFPLKEGRFSAGRMISILIIRAGVASAENIENRDTSYFYNLFAG